ncbi:hypothetical protein [Microbulbifer sp. ARAS458-1]|uniref:hypothetical protein n=1 Tax=Microbulbifer sp. ARAS458-1 TaxID=3140242 RepID=UPI003878007F
MPPPKQPKSLKLLKGSRRIDENDSLELPPLEDIPPPPDWLPNSHALREWERLSGLLHANGLLTEGCLSPLAHLCALHGKIVQQYAAGAAPTGHIIAQYRALAGEFGLTPSTATKVSPGSAHKKNKFANGGPTQGSKQR